LIVYVFVFVHFTGIKQDNPLRENEQLLQIYGKTELGVCRIDKIFNPMKRYFIYSQFLRTAIPAFYHSVAS